MSKTSKYIYEDNYLNIKYIVELSWNERNIIFNVKQENAINKGYESLFSLSSLIDKNHIFKVFNTIEDCYNYFLNLLNSKKYKVIKEADNIILCFFIKNLTSEKDEEMKLNLASKILEVETISENYNTIINDLKKENKILKEEISSLKDEILKLKSVSEEYKSFKEKIYSIIDERIKIGLAQLKENNNQILDNLNYSSILSIVLKKKIIFKI